MSSHKDGQRPSTSKFSSPPNKKSKIAERKKKSSSAASNTTTSNKNLSESSRTQTLNTVVVKNEFEENGSCESEIKVEKEDEELDTLTYSLEDVTKFEVKDEDEESEDGGESYSNGSPNLELKEEELIIKEETDDEDEECEAPSTSSASTQTESSLEDKQTAFNQEVERLLAQLRPKKTTIKGCKVQFTETDVFQFTITLIRGRGAPKIWRRFQVPIDYTFREFHIAIQKAMGWKSIEYDYHLHAFRLINPSTGFEDSIVISEDVGLYGASKDENVTKIKDYFTIIHHTGKYEYDFGIGWDHEFVFEGAFPRLEGRTYPVCLEGAKACPPEDGVVGSDEEYDSDVFEANTCF